MREAWHGNWHHCWLTCSLTLVIWIARLRIWRLARRHYHVSWHGRRAACELNRPPLPETGIPVSQIHCIVYRFRGFSRNDAKVLPMSCCVLFRKAPRKSRWTVQSTKVPKALLFRSRRPLSCGIGKYLRLVEWLPIDVDNRDMLHCSSGWLRWISQMHCFICSKQFCNTRPFNRCSRHRMPSIYTGTY